MRSAYTFYFLSVIILVGLDWDSQYPPLGTPMYTEDIIMLINHTFGYSLSHCSVLIGLCVCQTPE